MGRKVAELGEKYSLKGAIWALSQYQILAVMDLARSAVVNARRDGLCRERWPCR
jgi:hypothetical protein